MNATPDTELRYGVVEDVFGERHFIVNDFRVGFGAAALVCEQPDHPVHATPAIIVELAGAYAAAETGTVGERETFKITLDPEDALALRHSIGDAIEAMIIRGHGKMADALAAAQARVAELKADVETVDQP